MLGLAALLGEAGKQGAARWKSREAANEGLKKSGGKTKKKENTGRSNASDDLCFGSPDGNRTHIVRTGILYSIH